MRTCQRHTYATGIASNVLVAAVELPTGLQAECSVVSCGLAHSCSLLITDAGRMITGNMLTTGDHRMPT